jgi:hypothetical protein
MDSDRTQDWRTLKHGDNIRIVRIPSLFSEPHYHNGEWEETFALYRHLIAEQEILSIAQLDEYGRPWIEYESTAEDGAKVSNALAVDDDSWERVS